MPLIYSGYSAQFEKRVQQTALNYKQIIKKITKIKWKFLNELQYFDISHEQV